MKSTIDIVDILYKALKVTDVINAVSGGIYKSKRPINSKNIDIVIGCLPVNNLQLQTAVANVNIHVPNLKVVGNALQDNSQPNFDKLRSITALVISKLNDVFVEDYGYDVQQQNVFEEPDLNEHYSNIRIKFYSINL